MKRVFPFFLLPGLLLWLVGCSMPFSVTQDLTVEGSVPMGALEGEQYTLAIPEKTASPIVSPQTVCLWAREQLDADAQAAYDRLSAAIACYEKSEIEVTIDADEIKLVLTALRIDHPEYFWFNGEASYLSSSLPILGGTTTCTLHYTIGAEEAQQRMVQVNQYVSECLSSAELEYAETDYEKILGVYRYIINHTDYALSATDQSMISVMTDRRGTCAGYARTFQYLMHQLNIPCTLALGLGDKGESHGWNIVQCDGQWYHVDVTWGDPVGEDGLPGASLSYTYCMVTDDEILRDHTLLEDIPMPVCSNIQWNYFRQSGRYLTDWDSAAYEALLLQAAEAGESQFAVRFAQQKAYDAALTALIDQGEILTMMDNLDILPSEYGVTYSQNDQFLEFSVQLPSG